MWWYYLYSQDEDYLRTQAYPVIRECTRFYENFVVRAADGGYDVPPTNFGNLCYDIPDKKNCAMDLAFVRFLMRACLAASRVLGVDEENRPIWKDIADNLRPCPTTYVDPDKFAPKSYRARGSIPLYSISQAPEGEVFVFFEGMPVIEIGYPFNTMALFPGDDIGLHSPAETQEIAWRTAYISPYVLWDDLILLTMAWVRLGYDQLDIFEQHTKRVRLPNGCMTYPAGHRQDAFVNYFGWPVVINESILQIYTGQLRVAPVKLKYGVRFAQLRTVGAFLVSGEIRPGGDVSYITIASEAGEPCSLIRPWEGVVRIREWPATEPVQTTESDGVLSFETRQGATYIVDRRDDAWEQQPITTIDAPEAEPT